MPPQFSHSLIVKKSVTYETTKSTITNQQKATPHLQPSDYFFLLQNCKLIKLKMTLEVVEIIKFLASKNNNLNTNLENF